MVRRHYLVTGRVQGVNFRRFVATQARALGLVGRVRNLVSGPQRGCVEILAQGEEATLTRFLEQVHKGPPLAQVTDVKITELPMGEATGVNALSEQWFAERIDFFVADDGEETWLIDG